VRVGWGSLHKPPTAFPNLPPGQSLIGGLTVPGGEERLFVCESLEDMQKLDEAYGSGRALGLRWYFAAVHDATLN
jgi:hypothetical protein